jgi:hypothetical protein
MAIEIFVRKLYDKLVPADQVSADAMENLKPNGEYKAVFTQPRNAKFHKKAFVLANIGFEAWEPPADKEYNGKPILKNFDSFREQLTIRAGFYDVVWTIDGKMKLIAHSWSWASTEQTKFEEMYSQFINVILSDIMTNYTRADLDAQVNKILGFC